MKKIEAKIVADSISPQGHRIISMLLTYPRFIHGELMTHRMFSRNSASSRAIPFDKMVKSIEEDPFIPIAWQKDHKGMQGNDYIKTEDGLYVVTRYWLEARDRAIKAASDLHSCYITKQLCNRILEPFMWHTTLITATEFSNFFELRCPKLYHAATGLPYNSLKDWNNVDTEIQWDGLSCQHPENTSGAEIHIQALAESMWDAMNESIPKQLESGQWHIPFGDKLDSEKLAEVVGFKTSDYDWYNKEIWSKIKISTARCARLSYMTFEGEINYKKDLGLHDKLFIDKHKSPFEHCARAMNDEEYFSFIKGKYPTTVDSYGIVNYERYPFVTKEMDCSFIGVNPKNPDIYGWCNNFRGWVQYRYLVENE